MMAQNWVMMISELHRYQGVSYKSDIIVLSGDTLSCVLLCIIVNIANIIGLDIGDRQALEQKYSGCDPPCLLDSSDGR